MKYVARCKNVTPSRPPAGHGQQFTVAPRHFYNHHALWQRLKSIMSSGLGRIERTILMMVKRAERAKATVRIEVWDVASEVYEGDRWDWQPTRAHRVAIFRAMHSFVRKHPRYELAGGKGRSPLLLIRPDQWVRDEDKRVLVTPKRD